MKILIINPNSDEQMTAAIHNSAQEFAGNDFEVKTLSTPGAPKFIETYADQAAAAPGMVEIVRLNQDKYDAFVVACHCDPNLDLLKEVSNRVVIGIGEASMKMASMLGHRFSVLATDQHSVPNKEALIHKYHLQESLASVRTPTDKCQGDPLIQQYISAGRTALAKDKAEVLVLGCAGLAGMAKELEATLQAPVLDGVICALTIAWGLTKHGVGISKVRRYNPEY